MIPFPGAVRASAAGPFEEALAEDGIPVTRFEVDDVQAEYERLKECGVRFTQGPTDLGQATRNVDRYISGYERVRLLARSHPPERIPALADMSASLVDEYLELLRDFEPESLQAWTDHPSSTSTPRPGVRRSKPS